MFAANGDAKGTADAATGGAPKGDVNGAPDRPGAALGAPGAAGALKGLASGGAL